MTIDFAAKFRTLEAALTSVFFEREREVRALIIATLAGEHALLLGPPGTGKSALTQAFSAALGGTYFQRLVTKFSVPEELFGPFSLAGLEDDRYERKVDGYMPTAEVAFLDEVFKANSAILNSLLTILNEREFDNGTNRLKCPLKVCIGASNELPNNDEGDCLDALYDRFTLRRWVEPLKSRDSRRALLRMKGAPAVAVQISDTDLAQVRAAVAACTVTDEAIDALLDLQEKLAEDHGIAMSDRRLRKCEKLMRAAAVLDGRSEAVTNDMAILADSLWSSPDDRTAVELLVFKLADADLAEATNNFDAAVEAFGTLDMDAFRRKHIAAASQVIGTLKDIQANVRAMESDHPKIAQVVDGIQDMVDQVAKAVSRAM